MAVRQARGLRNGDETMSMQFGPALEAELSYHREKQRDDYRRASRPLLRRLRAHGRRGTPPSR